MTVTHSSGPAAQAQRESAGGANPVVVGVATIEHDLKAVDWAIEEANSRSVGVHLVHCWAWSRLAPWTSEFDDLVIADLIREGRAVLAKARSYVEQNSSLKVSTEIVGGVASDVLAKLGKSAPMIVLGSRHRNSVDRAMLGSVSNDLVARATCPVVVLGAPAAIPDTGARVVAGISGTEQDDAVLAFAFDEAQRRAVGLKVIFCWHPPWGDEQLPPPERAHRMVDNLLAPLRQRYPDVDVHPVVVRDHPADALIDAAASQELLVVGRRARRVRLGHLLGSVSLAVLHHATCPVAIVPARPHSEH